MTDTSWIQTVIVAARPRAMAALLRAFRDLDLAEEAFQEASLRALKTWPQNGPPRDTAAWLIMVARNAGIDSVRRQRKTTALPDEGVLSDLSDAEAGAVQRIDDAHYRDDILRLLFVVLPSGSAGDAADCAGLRIVSGLSVRQIARAFLVTEAAMEQRITRAKARIGRAGIPFEPPGPAQRAERLGAVMAMLYLVFNEGYTTQAVEPESRRSLCDEAIRLGRLLLGLFPTEPELMGLLALFQLQHARAPARFTEEGIAVPLERQDRSLWRQELISEGLALMDKAIRHGRPGPYQVQGPSRHCTRALPGPRTPTGSRSICCTARSSACSLPPSSRSIALWR